MRPAIGNLICVIVLGLILVHSGARAQNAGADQSQPFHKAVATTGPTFPEDWTGPLGIAAKKPVFAGACKACPWGQLGIVTKQAMASYGYDVHICWNCATNVGVHAMGDKVAIQQPPPPPDSLINAYFDKTPPEVPDISATSESNLIDAWNGTGAYAPDKKLRRNYRVVASVQTPNYLVVAVNKKSNITDLAQLKTRRNTFVFAAENDPVLAYYGITKAMLEANGGGLIPTGSSAATRELRAGADVWIGGAVLANTWEQRMWYEISQMNDLVYLPLPGRIAGLRWPGMTTAMCAVRCRSRFLRGVDRPISTVMRENHLIYVRDDAPDDFAYAVAKALDEHRDFFTHQIEPWYYDPRKVAISATIPLHPGALKYYRERGYVK